MTAIVLVRHGRSGHVHSGWINREQFLSWREAYELTGIHQDDLPPRELKAAAASSGVIAASTAPRAIESARLLAPGREISTSPLLAELELAPPNLGRMRMPLPGWMIAIAVQWAARAILRRVHASEAELERSRDAAAWLIDLATSHENVLAVTHGSLRLLLSDRLVEQGWRRELPRRRNGHWSAWPFTASR